MKTNEEKKYIFFVYSTEINELGLHTISVKEKESQFNSIDLEEKQLRNKTFVIQLFYSQVEYKKQSGVIKLTLTSNHNVNYDTKNQYINANEHNFLFNVEFQTTDRGTYKNPPENIPQTELAQFNYFFHYIKTKQSKIKELLDTLIEDSIKHIQITKETKFELDFYIALFRYAYHRRIGIKVLEVFPTKLLKDTQQEIDKDSFSGILQIIIKPEYSYYKKQQ